MKARFFSPNRSRLALLRVAVTTSLIACSVSMRKLPMSALRSRMTVISLSSFLR